jgi:single-strand DNA-binding protein
MSTPVTLRGRLAADPEMRYSAQGKPVATFTVMTSRRVRDPQTGEWSDRDTTGWRCVAFGDLAEHIAESLEKGTAVIIDGHAAQEEWETRDGEKRRSMKVTVDDAAPSLRWASAKVTRASRSKPAQQQGQGKPTEGPWASGPSGGSDDEPPF